MKCTTHPDELAGWQCRGDCKAYLCPKCTAQLVRLYTCCRCGGPAHRLSVPRRSKGLAHWIGVAIARPLKMFPMFALFVLLLGGIAFVDISSGTPEVHRIATIVKLALVTVYALFVVDAAAHGAPDSRTPLRVARALAAVLFVLAPGIVYAYFVGVPGAAAQHDHAMWLFGGLVVAYVPVALAVAVSEAPMASLMNPFTMFEVAWRLGRTYLGTLVVVAVLVAAAVSLATGGSASLKQSVPTPLVGDAVAAIPWLWSLGALAAMIGLLTYVHGDRFGWGHTAEYVEPLYPKMVALGARKLADRSSAAAGMTGEITRLDAAERADAGKLDDALRTENAARAIKLYEGRATWSAAAVDDRKLVAIARCAVRVKRLDLAERLLDDAVARKGRSCGQAMLALAQLHGDSLGNADRAAALYASIVEQFAGSDVAKVAAKKLAG
ncbi:MAG: hypothetical protein JO257_18875 [Deltaproteobacteria bacterium]|nr:hypothetical protein [Deltaproteobacteria bacterium]